MSSQKVSSEKQAWVLLSYRVPREPSAPRIAVWRRLKALGVAQIGDGLVALPATPKTAESLEWLAESVVEAKGEALVWHATTAQIDSEALVHRLQAERDAEYVELLDEVKTAGSSADGRSIGRWRRTLRDIERRDWLRSPRGDATRRAVHDAFTSRTPVKADL